MRAMGFEMKKADVEKMLKDYDRDGSGKINFEDFSVVSKPHPHHACSLLILCVHLSSNIYHLLLIETAIIIITTHNNYYICYSLFVYKCAYL